LATGSVTRSFQNETAITDGIAEGFLEISSLIRPVIIGKREISGGGNPSELSKAGKVNTKPWNTGKTMV